MADKIIAVKSQNILHWCSMLLQLFVMIKMYFNFFPTHFAITWARKGKGGGKFRAVVPFTKYWNWSWASTEMHQVKNALQLFTASYIWNTTNRASNNWRGSIADGLNNVQEHLIIYKVYRKLFIFIVAWYRVWLCLCL